MQICLNRTAFFSETAHYPFATKTIASQVHAFHKTLPQYQPTPLVSLNSLANHLGLGALWVKDESQRFDLNAFKVLGASYAVAQCLAEHLDISVKDLSFSKITDQRPKYKELTLVTATDGNHGRAVAWVAQKFGCAAQVYLPAGAEPERLKAIQSYGASAKILDVSYDQAVAHAAQVAKSKNHILIQDTSWPNYQKIPLWIVQGYLTLLSESFLELPKHELPTHVFVQAGVGSLPAALVAHLRECTIEQPVFTVVEPTNADCLFSSMQQNNGESMSLSGHLKTIMAGLACGTPSQDALAVLRASANAFMTCDDAVAERGMRVLGNPLGNDQRIVSGESGAVTLGAVYELCTNPLYQPLREQINLHSNSKVLLFSTEGDTAPNVYRDIVWQR